MIDVDAMQDLIRAANPVTDRDQLDPDEVARFVAVTRGGEAPLAGRDARTSEVELQMQPARSPSLSREVRRVRPGWGSQRRGLAVAVRIAVLLALVGAALLLLARDAQNNTTPPADTDPSVVDPRLRSTIHLTVDPDSPPVVISTAIGDLEFVSLQYEPIGYHLNGEAEVTPYGLVASEHGRLWWSTDFLSWNSAVPSVRTNGRVTVVGDDVIVHGRGASARFSWDGAGWSEAALLELDGLDASVGDGLEQMVFGSQGAVAVAGNTFFYSPDGVSFVAAAGPDVERVVRRSACPEIGSAFFRGERILATSGGFVTFTAGYPTDQDDSLCSPLLWTSVDGSSWDLVSDESPFGEAAVISDVADRNGRFIAVGSTAEHEPATWVSDDGVNWVKQILELDAIDGLAAGELGWVIIGSSPGRTEQTMLFSRNGDVWDGPYARPEGFGSAWLPVPLTVGPDFIINTDAPALGRLQD